VANDSANVVIGGTGTISVAPAGSTLPTTLDGALDAAFTEVGYVTEDGVEFSDKREIDGVAAWQSGGRRVRSWVKARESKLATELMEWTGDNLVLAFGGGTVTHAGGDFKFTPPTEDDALTEYAVVVDVVDGDESYRVVVANAVVENEIKTSFSGAGAATLPVEFTVQDDGTNDPWVVYSDNVAWAT